MTKFIYPFTTKWIWIFTTNGYLQLKAYEKIYISILYPFTTKISVDTST